MIRINSTLATCVALPLIWSCSAPSNEGELPPPQTKPGDFVTASDGTDDAAGSDDAESMDMEFEDGLSAPQPGSGGSTVAVVVPENSGELGSEGLISESETVPESEQETECSSATTGTSLVSVVLAFTFDVSASMGSHFEPWYSRELKWQPVVDATKAFFADASSAGISATLTFFPNDQASLVGGGVGVGVGGGGASCDGDNYGDPDVPLTALPSDAFSTAIDAVTPAGDDDWRLGTPTGPALEGTLASIEAMKQVDPNAKYVIVLVTDGEPALCSAQQDDINAVAGVVRGVAEETPTYVIGIGNPPTTEEPMPPDDGVSNLHAIAEAGGTTQAYLIDPTNPTQTAADFRAVIDAIRESSFTCAVEIPAPPPGQAFNKDKVNVEYSNTMGATPFIYDPTCAADFAWYYDDETNPSVILMCDNVCEDIRADYQNEGQLGVQFGCIQRIPTAN